MKQKRIAKNFLYHTLYQILLLIAPLITAPYVSRVLGATGIGIYNYSQSIASYFMLIGAMGTTLYGQREIAYVQDDPEKRSYVFWEVEVLRACMTAFCVLIYVLAFCRHGQYRQIYTILVIEVLATAFDISWLFMGLEEFKITVLRNTVIKLTGIALVFLLVKSPEDLPLYAFCLSAPTLIGNLSLWLNLRTRVQRLSISAKDLWRRIKRRIRPILVLFLPQIASEVYLVLDKTMIGLLGSEMAQVGYYTQGQRIIKIALAVILSLGTVMLPAMSAAYAAGDTKGIVHSVERSLRIVFMLSFAMMFGINAVAPKFVPIFFGQGYEPVIPLMSIISPILVIIGISNVFGKQFLLPTGQQSAFTASIVTGACINFTLNLLLIPRFDALGASVATVVAELGVTAVQFFCVRSQLPLRRSIGPFFKYLVLSMVMFAAVRFVGSFLGQRVIDLIIIILTGIAVYALELLMTRDPMLKWGLALMKSRD